MIAGLRELVCEHGQQKSICLICARDAEIARLKAENEQLRMAAELNRDTIKGMQHGR